MSFSDWSNMCGGQLASQHSPTWLLCSIPKKCNTHPTMGVTNAIQGCVCTRNYNLLDADQSVCLFVDVQAVESPQYLRAGLQGGPQLAGTSGSVLGGGARCGGAPFSPWGRRPYAWHGISNWHRGGEDAVATILGPNWLDDAKTRQEWIRGRAAFVTK